MTPDLPYPPNHPRGQHGMDGPNGDYIRHVMQTSGQAEDEELKPVPTPEEMADQLGCAVHELGQVMVERLGEMSKQLDELQRRMTPSKPNRAQRRAMAKGGKKIPNHAVRTRR